MEAKPKGALFFQNKFSRQKFSRVIKFSPESVFHKKPNFHSKVGPGESGESNESKNLALALLGRSQFRGFQNSDFFRKIFKIFARRAAPPVHGMMDFISDFSSPNQIFLYPMVYSTWGVTSYSSAFYHEINKKSGKKEVQMSRFWTEKKSVQIRCCTEHVFLPL